MPQNPKRIQYLVLAWATTIFITSCTFIERRVFINFVKQFIPAGMPQHLWINFWGAFGLLVVKAYHMTEYAVLCYLLFLLLSTRPFKKPGTALLLAATFAALYAVTDEWHQTFVPGRGGTWVDVVIDCCGIGLASAAIILHSKRRQREALQ